MSKNDIKIVHHGKSWMGHERRRETPPEASAKPEVDASAIAAKSTSTNKPAADQAAIAAQVVHVLPEIDEAAAIEAARAKRDEARLAAAQQSENEQPPPATTTVTALVTGANARLEARRVASEQPAPEAETPAAAKEPPTTDEDKPDGLF